MKNTRRHRLCSTSLGCHVESREKRRVRAKESSKDSVKRLERRRRYALFGKCTSLFVLLVEVGGINESIREVRSVREKRTSIERLGKGERRGIAELLAVVLPLPEDLRNCSMYQLHDESRCINYLLADK
ncbi:hypothetical protein HZH68_003336 [Vespula germanica]|uniref:Uncharacterized protein n=1 Tax=Vespula germanica TaxID=30212 RepID=A0A834NP18_VESGE|nr:hypothetical protein HZH68_003336 [Vespula germanica]